MLHAVWDQPVSGQYLPAFRQNVRIEQGTLVYNVPTSSHARLAKASEAQC
jgi:hypothetical protein